MMTVNSPDARVHCYGVSLRHCACNASANSARQALHFAPPSHVQTACPKHDQSVVVAAFADVLPARAAAPPACRSREPKRPAKAKGKIKGRSTKVCAQPVCTGEECGTRHKRHRAAISFNALPTLMNLRACFACAR